VKDYDTVCRVAARDDPCMDLWGGFTGETNAEFQKRVGKVVEHSTYPGYPWNDKDKDSDSKGRSGSSSSSTTTTTTIIKQVPVLPKPTTPTPQYTFTANDCIGLGAGTGSYANGEVFEQTLYESCPLDPKTGQNAYVIGFIYGVSGKPLSKPTPIFSATTTNATAYEVRGYNHGLNRIPFDETLFSQSPIDPGSGSSFYTIGFGHGVDAR
jgi:hypothetical protein